MILNIFKSQKGAFSPFMFGMLMGVGILSAVTQQWAQKYAQELEEQRLTTAQENAAEIRQAMENTILLEDSATYDADITTAGALDSRVLQQASSTGKTRGGSNVQIKEVSSTTEFGLQNKRIVVTATDDTYVKADVAALADVSAVIAYDPTDNAAVEVFDSSEARRKQVDLSYDYLLQAADSVYGFYAENLRFPTVAEYAQIENLTRLKDVWGNGFTYERGDDYAAPEGDQVGRITMQTPWGYTRTIPLDVN
jgi:hypothetical protein